MHLIKRTYINTYILHIYYFNIYVNDIVHASEILKFALFADDTNILFSNKNYERVENKVNTELNNIIYILKQEKQTNL